MMTTLTWIVAQSAVDIIRPGQKLGTSSRLVMGDLLLIIAASLLAAAVLVSTLLVVRNRKKRRSRGRNSHRSRDSNRAADEVSDTAIHAGDDADPAGGSAEGGHSGHGRKRRRKRRRNHRQRNPTLSETGGLPPSRSDSAPIDPQI